jgi:hypothetical protein
MAALADFPVAQADPRTDCGPSGPGLAAVPGADRSGAVRNQAKIMRSWPLLVLAVLPGIWPSLHLDTAVTLPVGVECYAAYALRAWLASGHAISDRTRRFARRSAIFSFALGMAGQVAFHLMDQDHVTRAPWGITTLVSCLPVLVLGMGTALAHMLREDAAATNRPDGRSAGPADVLSPSRSAEDQHADQSDRHQDHDPNQDPPDRTTGEPRLLGRTGALPWHDRHAAAEPVAPVPHAAEPGIEHARRIARELAGAGHRVSRRALRSRGIRGSNEALNALALTLSAELANGTGRPSVTR